MAPRRVAAVLLAVFLNLALVPCAMALEAADDGHDCCPPDLRLDPADCCQIDAGTTDARTGTVKLDLDQGPAVGPAWADLAPAPASTRYLVADPPDPPGPRPDLNTLFCIYLK